MNEGETKQNEKNINLERKHICRIQSEQERRRGEMDDERERESEKSSKRKCSKPNGMNVEKRIIRIWILIKIQEKNFKCFFIYEMRFHEMRTHMRAKS